MKRDTIYLPSDWVETVLFPPEAVLYDERVGQVHYLNPAATEIWLSLSALVTPMEVATTIALRHGLSVAEIMLDVESAIVEFKANGLLLSIDPN